MKLTQVGVDGFRSVKERIKLFIDPKVTVLIGANDHGKTTLLEAIRFLNDDKVLTVDDRNWDLDDLEKPILVFSFALDGDEVAELTAFANLEAKREQENFIADEKAKIAAEKARLAAEDPTSNVVIAEPLTLANPEWDYGRYPIPKTVKFRKIIGGAASMQSDPFFDKLPTAVDYLKKRLPRVELFAPVSQLMDVVTLPQLEQPDQEFMQGIFRYAGIWDGHAKLFKQDPATARRLEQASDRFTKKIRTEWKQGENLTFRFQHSGTNGNQIDLLICDPAVSNRYVRPSERSAGFSAFFTMSMRMLSRTEANPANKYIFLFDEPGTALHPAGQVNLQRVFERLSLQDQIVYATHSLFMVNHNRPERNRVVSKDQGGTKVDQKPYLRNWRAVRDSLGLILAGTFFIADTTLLVEGESDAMYIGSLLAAFDRAEFIDIDLNLFSVQWPGNAGDFEPMARLMLEEGRHVVSLVDGDRSGSEIRKNLEKLNEAVQAKRVNAVAPVEIVQLEKGKSIEDILPCPQDFLEVVAAAATELVANGFLTPAEGVDFDPKALLGTLNVDHDGITLGRYMSNVTKTWFKEKEPISKLTIAHKYCSWLEGKDLREVPGVTLDPTAERLKDVLRLESKVSESAVVEEPIA
jgi:energy-coupling factor transporter ATP-binding protein EcfA2